MFFRSKLKKFSSPNTSTDFQNQVIQAVLEKFICGPTYLKSHPGTDDCEFIRDAHRIKDTSLIASSGPQNTNDMIHFIQDTAYHDNPILHVVALGDRLFEPESRSSNADFLNYFLGNFDRTYGEYHVNAKIIRGQASLSAKQHESKPNQFVESELKITYQDEVRLLNVIGIELTDGHAIKISNDENNQMLKLILKIHQLSLDHSVLLHCKRGHGRTGNLALALLLFNNFNTIFSNHDPTVVANNILDLITRIRNDRSGLISLRDQVRQAILIAYKAYQHELNDDYEQTLQNKFKIAAKKWLAH